MTCRRWVLLTAVLAVVILRPTPSDTCGPFFTTVVFVHEHGPDRPITKFAAGRLGVVLPTWYRPFLVVSYRYLSGKPLTKAEQKAFLSEWTDDGRTGPEEGDSMEDWLAARAVYRKDPPQSHILKQSHLWRQWDMFDNCPRAAFETAIDTLHDRAEKFGRTSNEFRQWLDGQDIVFRNCDLRE